MEKITLQCNINILNLLKQYNIYTKAFVNNPKKFLAKIKTRVFWLKFLVILIQIEIISYYLYYIS
ncbi:hypothetical protein B11476_03100 [Campylobacter coli]|nr:hypothetical protein B11476_03100 [Campylobacter coli]